MTYFRSVWLLERDKFLKDHYAVLGPQACTEAFNKHFGLNFTKRKISARASVIGARASVIGVSKKCPRGWRSFGECARALGIDRDSLRRIIYGRKYKVKSIGRRNFIQESTFKELLTEFKSGRAMKADPKYMLLSDAAKEMGYGSKSFLYAASLGLLRTWKFQGRVFMLRAAADQIKQYLVETEACAINWKSLNLG